MLASAIRSFALTSLVSPVGDAPPGSDTATQAEPEPAQAEPALRTYEGAAEVSPAGEDGPESAKYGLSLSPRDDDVMPPGAPARSTRPRRHRIVYRNLVAARYNPLGLVDELYLGYRMQLAQKPGLLWRDSSLAVHAHLFATPAFATVGPWVELQPFGIWQIAAGYDFMGYFGALNQLASFESPTEPYDEDTLDARGDAGRNYATSGHLVTLSNLLQVKVKGFAIRDNLRFYWNDMHLRGGDRVWYDQAIDILMPDRGWALTNDLDAVWLFDFGLTIGARYTLTHAFYEQRHFRFGEPMSQPNGPTHRVGPAVVYTFFDRPGAAFNKPSIVVLSQWWVRHRWRTGEVGSAAAPYFVVAFAFEGDLWPRARGKSRPGRAKRGARGP